MILVAAAHSLTLTLRRRTSLGLRDLTLSLSLFLDAFRGSFAVSPRKDASYLYSVVTSLNRQLSIIWKYQYGTFRAYSFSWRWAFLCQWTVVKRLEFHRWRYNLTYPQTFFFAVSQKPSRSAHKARLKNSPPNRMRGLKIHKEHTHLSLQVYTVSHDYLSHLNPLEWLRFFKRA